MTTQLIFGVHQIWGLVQTFVMNLRGFVNPHPSGWRLSKDRLEEEYQKGNIVIRPDGKLERRKYLKDYKGASYGTYMG